MRNGIQALLPGAAARRKGAHVISENSADALDVAVEEKAYAISLVRPKKPVGGGRYKVAGRELERANATLSRTDNGQMRLAVYL